MLLWAGLALDLAMLLWAPQGPARAKRRKKKRKKENKKLATLSIAGAERRTPLLALQELKEGRPRIHDQRSLRV